ncbi:Diaminopimelate decarboxylase [Listeria monocytogenes N53-1]|nr:Diaminopimelate decarboxylase [Listeria monocytogenes N53-1]
MASVFVIDNYYEISLLEDILIERNEKASVLIRVTPGIEAHTHDYILTGQDDSKFGFGMDKLKKQLNKCFMQVRPLI